MIKMIRQTLGGTWLKIKSLDKTKEYWVRPTHPDALEKLSPSHIVKKERYSHCLIPNQCLSPV